MPKKYSKLKFLTVACLAAVCAQSLASAATAVVSNLLVSGHGGIIKGNVIGDVSQNDAETIIVNNLRFKTGYGEIYYFTNNDNVTVKTVDVSKVLCAKIAPAG